MQLAGRTIPPGSDQSQTTGGNPSQYQTQGKSTMAAGTLAGIRESDAEYGSTSQSQSQSQTRNNGSELWNPDPQQQYYTHTFADSRVNALESGGFQSGTGENEREEDERTQNISVN